MSVEPDLDFAPIREDRDIAPHSSDVFGRLAKGWTVIFACVLLGIGAFCIRTALAQPVYRAKATLFFPTRTPSVLGQAGATEAAASTAAAVFGVGPTPIRIYRGFLESETALDFVSKQSGKSREVVLAMRKLEEEASTSTLTISAKSSDKAEALKIVSLHVDELGNINQRMGMNAMTDDVAVIEQELQKAKKRLREAEQLSIRLQDQAVSAPTISSNQTGVQALPGGWAQQLLSLRVQKSTQDQALVAAQKRVNQLAAKGIRLSSELPPIKKYRPILTKLQLELKTKEVTLGPDASEIRILKSDIRTNQEALREELTDYVRAVDVGLLDPTVQEGGLPELLATRVNTDAQIASLRKLVAQAPREATLISRSLREVSIQGAMVQQLTSQLELSKLQASRDPNRWSLLDEPRIEDEPVNKSFVRAGLYGIVSGLFLGVVVVLFVSRRRN